MGADAGEGERKKLIAALIDLRFASPAAAAKFTCSRCPEGVQKSRRCHDPSFEVMKRISVDEYGAELTFCPGKATWYEEIRDVYQDCRVALETGILPKEGSLESQDELFAHCFPTFVERWRDRNYEHVWKDVRAFAKNVLEAVLGK